MATYRGTGLKPVETGDIRKDVSRLFDALYETDEELRYLFCHLDSENFTGYLKGFTEKISSPADGAAGVENLWSAKKNSFGAVLGGVGLDNGSLLFTDNPEFTPAVSLTLEDGHLRFCSENKKSVNLDINLSGGVNIIGSPLTLNGHAPFTFEDVIPIANGGTGATTANAAANNLSEVGTWTPRLTNAEGSAPTYTTEWNIGYYVKIGRLVWVHCDIAPGISNIGGNYAQISGLPYASDGSYGLILVEGYQVLSLGGNSDLAPTVHTYGSAVRVRTPNGSGSYNWLVNTSVGTNVGRLRFSGVYRTS